jgi:hypothetical protein
MQEWMIHNANLSAMWPPVCFKKEAFSHLVSCVLMLRIDCYAFDLLSK